MPPYVEDFRKRRLKWISEGGAVGRQSNSNLGGCRLLVTNKDLAVSLLTTGNIYCTFSAPSGIVYKYVSFGFICNAIYSHATLDFLISFTLD